MRTMVSVVVFSFVVLVLVSQTVLAGSWGGGVSVPGWQPSDYRSWGREGNGGYSDFDRVRYSAPGIAYYWAPPSPASTQVACVVNPSTNRDNLTFWVDNQPFVLAPGMQQEVSFVPGQAIQFDRGAGRGMARYSLEGTSFTFAPTSAGWELYRTLPGASSNIAASQPSVPGSASENARSTPPATSSPRPLRR